MRYLQGAPPGIIIYLQQEGRGIGLANKIAAYSLQAWLSPWLQAPGFVENSLEISHAVEIIPALSSALEDC